MESNFVTSVIVPICLAIMMIGLGMALIPDDFKRVVVYPKAVALGLFFQMIALPVVAFVVAGLFPLSPELAVGIMVLACCPGGIPSNVLTHIARGDTALAVTLTVVSSFFAVVTIPLITTFSLNHFMGATSEIDLPLWEMALKVFLLTVPTVLAGMAIKAKAPSFARKGEKYTVIGGVVFLLLVVAGVLFKERQHLGDWSFKVGPATFVLCIATMAISYFGSRGAKVSRPQSISISIGTGFQNAALALVIATSFLKNTEIAISPTFYAFVTTFVAAVVAGYMNLKLKQPT